MNLYGISLWELVFYAVWMLAFLGIVVASLVALFAAVWRSIKGG